MVVVVGQVMLLIPGERRVLMLVNGVVVTWPYAPTTAEGGEIQQSSSCSKIRGAPS